jgi:hypothetical protein
VANGNLVWNPPVWTDYGWKHFPDRSLSWDEIVRRTGGKKGIAKYHPNMSRAMIEEVEMSSLGVQGNEIDDDHPKPHVRMFWRDLQHLDFPVGASEGFPTTYIYVEYHSSGVVHGRPISRKLLTLKGAHL